MGRQVTTVGEVTEYEPNRKYAHKLVEGSSLIKAGQLLFEPEGSGVRVSYKIQIEAGGIFALVEGLLASAMKEEGLGKEFPGYKRNSRKSQQLGELEFTSSGLR